MNSRVLGIFSVLVLGVMMLLIPTTAVVKAQEYEKVDKKLYSGQYKKDDKTDEPVIIIKNEPI